MRCQENFGNQPEHQRRQPAGGTIDESEAPMTRQKPDRGFSLTRSDQVTIVAVAAAIMVITALLVGLLF
jgi:hypothetical protein